MELTDRAPGPGESVRDCGTLLVGEIETGDLLGSGDHFLGDGRTLLLVRLRPEDARQQRGAEPERAEVRHELATIVGGVRRVD